MEGLLKYFWLKVSATIPICFVTFSQDHININYAIVYIIIIDTILGVWVAVKYKIFSSHHLSRVFNKIATYAIAMLTVWVLSAVEPVMFGWAYRWMGLFIVITEIFSNFEKLALLGLRTPTLLLARLNKQFNQLLYSDNKEEVAENILKNRNDKNKDR